MSTAHPQKDAPGSDDLQALRKTLEEYAYAVSHDFGAPFRHIREFTNLLLGKLGDKVGPEERKYVTVIEQSLKRSEEMLEGLVYLSRLDSRAEPFAVADAAALAADAKHSLARQIEDSGARIHIGPLPQLFCDGCQIKQLFYHLLDNAIKFRRPDIAPDIHIEAVHQKERWLFLVRDNGTGIDPAQREQAFILFRRLHGREDLPGVGVGLALARKIVERHGGRIWCEPAEGQGAVFAVSLPIEPHA